MRTLRGISRALTVALGVAVTAYGQVPAGNDTTAANSNMGVGSGALGGPKNTANGVANIAIGSDVLMYNTGSFNVSVGGLYWNTSGVFNTAVGSSALAQNTTGFWNTATGADAMEVNTAGSYNTAAGGGALWNNTTGEWNTAIGTGAMGQMTGGVPWVSNTGNWNTAVGGNTLNTNATGYDNVAIGYQSQYVNSSGHNNVATGQSSLYSNVSGSANTAIGDTALFYNTASENTAVGASALQSNDTGTLNTAVGYGALSNNTTGSNNIAIGNNAGQGVLQGSNNIEIGATGSRGENNIIRIGGAQTATFIAGIYNNPGISGLPVVITSTGQLGTSSSSARFKTAIAPMGSNTEKLRQLRPVTFRYKADVQGTLRYGLIAEEVAQVYPELVVRDRSGRIDGVRYDELAPMLLNELQKQQRFNAAQAAQTGAQATRIESLERQLAGLQAALLDRQPKDARVAQR